MNTPAATFANGVTQVGIAGQPTALRSARQCWPPSTGIGQHAGGVAEPRRPGIEAIVNKNTAANAPPRLQDRVRARALIGMLGSDDFSFKVSPDGPPTRASDVRNTGRVELPQPAILPAASGARGAGVGQAGTLRPQPRGCRRLDVMRPTGRDFPLQPHVGITRTANWAPSSGATISTEGMSNSTVGTVSTPGLAATSLATSMRRWRLTSAATADSAADQRSGVFTCWRGNAAGLGGWTFVTRISLATLQATGMAFFGLYGSTSALATTLALSAVVSCIGIGFQRGTHTRWQLVTNDASGAPTLVDMGASFAIATGGVLTLTIAASPNAGSVWVRVVDEVSGAVFEQEITTDLPAANQFLAPRLFMNNGATAAAVAFDCAGVYLETDF